MFEVIRSSWALLLGMMLLMVGNGLQGSLLGIRGAEAGFSPFLMSIVMSAYFLGAIIASRMVPDMIMNVGHVRVFAALGSIVSAVLILFPALPFVGFWVIGRAIIGFAFCGLYITSESWLNNASTNETRGKSLSLYMFVQMAGIITAQGMLVLPDASGFLLFVIPSVLVSLSFAPILLSASPMPALGKSKRMTLKDLYASSPLGCVGVAIMGVIFSVQAGMAAVYATEAGLTIGQTSIFIAAFFVGALMLQFPFGLVSDRMDRRVLIAFVAGLGGTASIIPGLMDVGFETLVIMAFLIGGATNPLYSLLLAHTNDFLEPDDMASASAGLQFLNGICAVMGPILAGYMMSVSGPRSYFLMIATPMFVLMGYAVYRTTRRPTASDTNTYVPISPSSSAIVTEAAAEWSHDADVDVEKDENSKPAAA